MKRIKMISMQLTVLLSVVLLCGASGEKEHHGNSDQLTAVTQVDWIGNRSYASNQPKPWTWNGDLSLLAGWTPESDPDRDYNRGTIPLKQKFTNQDYWANPNAKDSGYISICSPWWISGNSHDVSSGSNYFGIQTYTWWQYNDLYMIFNNWHTIPSVSLIDAAHRNGVRVYSLIMNPDIDEVTVLIHKEGETFPVADKMIEICEYYGFDGYFFNFETPGTSQLSEEVRDFLIYFNKQGEPKGIRIQWYDSWIESGAVSYQNELNTSNDWFFDYNGESAAQEMYLNYWYSEEDILDSRNLAESFGRNPWDVYGGFETWQNYWNTGKDMIDTDVLYVPHTLSISLFQMNGMIDIAQGNTIEEWNDDYYLQGEEFYSGANHDPSNTSSSKNWKGVAHYYPAKSVINETPFVTNFSVGNGHIFAIEGNISAEYDWNNRTIQDIPPTWRWIVQSNGAKLTPKFHFADAYYAGNSLKISGDLSSDNLIKLFMTNLEVESDSKIVIAFRDSIENSDSHMKIALSFTDAPDNWEYIEVGVGATSGWNLKEFDLGSYSGKTIGAIGLSFDGSAAQSDYEMLIGRMGVIKGSVDVPSAPSGLSIESKVEDVTNVASLRLKWNESISDVREYNVYRKNEDNSLTYVGGTTTNAYFVPQVFREGTEEGCTLIVEAVSKEFGYSSRITTEFQWSTVMSPDKVTYPSPSDGAENVGQDAELSWKSAEGAISYNVYFGMSNPPELIGTQTTTSFKPDTLEAGKTYYWRIDPTNDYGTTIGSIFTFTVSDLLTPPFDRTDESGGGFGALGENWENGEGAAQAFDNNIYTKWLDFAPSSNIWFRFGGGVEYAITEYSLTSANDFPERDPKRWTLKGSHDKVNWVLLDERYDQDFPERYQTKRYWIDNDSAYAYYKFDMTCTMGTIIQLAEIELIDYDGYKILPTMSQSPYPPIDTTDFGLAEMFRFSPGDNIYYSQIRLGNDPSLTEGFFLNTAENSFVPAVLEPNTTYYWKVDAVNNMGIVEGDIWSFSTIGEENGWCKLSYDDFENGFGNFSSGGSDCKIYSYGTFAKSGSNAVNLQDIRSDESTLTLSYNLDLSDQVFSYLKIDFWFTFESMEENEGFDVEFFNGTEWLTIGAFTFGTEYQNNISYHENIYLSSQEYDFTMPNSFRFVCKAGAPSDDVYIDDVKISIAYDEVNSSDNDKGGVIPTEYALKQNYPNPFNPSTRIVYNIPERSFVSIKIYDINGQEITNIINEEVDPGNYEFQWNAVNVSSGVYFISMRSKNFRDVKKCVLLK